ncbi:MAG: biopolymer transporter ExbD [Bacteroidetes bacterium]|jgi:biopolymer transport protein ExbD|nr:biopolymer transporter ExbD [Bacteroidota bacterium]MBT3749971.1 biopolymer transporter ExbD [Bacteroidota bacterium]MBT4399827.1 biopolymer transporter ExbD [Bacteroidota bacterium]MBT4410270.1 biopolymer transporter ExbD [Bacteroidota bacterium]MBT5427833.1 biopolymer transporter ExbD [Bacteroidota bacterium]
MAIKSRNKVNAQFSMSSMTDIVFLLLIFFMITSTMVHPNALKLLLPQSNSQVSAKPITTVSINRNLDFYIENTPIDFGRLEAALKVKFDGVPEEDRTVALHAEKSVPIDEVVKVMNIAKNNRYKLILATQSR